MHWVRMYCKDESNEFPLDIVQLIVNVFLYQKVKFLTFSSTYNYSTIRLTDNDRCAQNDNPMWGDEGYVLVDCPVVCSGLNVWRVKVSYILTANDL